LRQRRIIGRLVKYEGLVPALEKAFFVIVDDVGIDVVEPRFPAFRRISEKVIDEEGVGWVLLDRAELELGLGCRCD